MNDPKDHQQAISDLANAIQTAAPLADRIRVTLQQANDDAVKLDAAVDRAVRALKTIQPQQQTGESR